MMINKKFEEAAAFRSRVALLVALVVHLVLLGFLLFRNDAGLDFFTKQDRASTQAQLRP